MFNAMDLLTFNFSFWVFIMIRADVIVSVDNWFFIPHVLPYKRKVLWESESIKLRGSNYMSGRLI